MIFVTLVRRKNCCLVKALMCCSIEKAGMEALIQVRSTPCVMLGKKENSSGVTAKHVP